MKLMEEEEDLRAPVGMRAWLSYRERARVSEREVDMLNGLPRVWSSVDDTKQHISELLAVY